jgi:hypothetical protein
LASDAGDRALWPYAVEKLSAAVTVLATQPEEVRRRLYLAYEHLAMVPRYALPRAQRDQLEALLERLLRKELPPGSRRSRLNWNLKGMHKATAARIAQQIVRLQSEMEYLLDDPS